MYIPRNIDLALIEWKDDRFRKPMLLRGARQTGKTTAVRNFAKRFESFVELNFEKDRRLSGIFGSSANCRKPFCPAATHPNTAGHFGKPRCRVGTPPLPGCIRRSALQPIIP